MSETQADFSHELFTDVDLIERGINGRRADRSLELGCGYGRLSPWIARHSKEHHAIEPEAKLLEDARRLYPEVIFRDALAQDLPYDGSVFDLIVSFGVLTQVPDDQLGPVADELERVATDHGQVLIGEKVGTVENTDRIYTRSVAEYRSIFSAFDLVETIERPLEEDYWGEDFRYALLSFR